MIRTTAALGLSFLLIHSAPQAQPPGRGGQRGPDRAPAAGSEIPKVEAKTRDGKKTVKLNEPKRLTVLVFGSHT